MRQSPDFTETVGNTGNTGNAINISLENNRKCAATYVAHTPRRVGNMGNTRLDFTAINAAALRALPDLLARWLPDGRTEGHEWVARNLRSADHTPANDTGKAAVSVDEEMHHDR